MISAEDCAVTSPRKEARVPDDVTFRTKPEIALAQIGRPRAGVAPGVLLTMPVMAPRRVPLRRNSQRFDLVVGCNRRSASAPWRRTAAAKPLERTRPPAIAHAILDRECPLFPPRRWRGWLPEEAWRIVPWREGSNEIWSSHSPPADPIGFAGLEVFNASSAGMASHRIARGRKRADEILAFDPARRHADRRSRRHGQSCAGAIERDYERTQ